MKPHFKKYYLLLIAAILLIGMAASASAFNFQTPWPPSPMGYDIYKDPEPTLAKGVKYFYEWGVGLGGVAVFVSLVMAGFEYITSVGDPAKMKEAFNRIRDSVIGLLLLLSSYAILSFIGINLSSLKIDTFNPDAFEIKKTECSTNEGEAAPDCCKVKTKTGEQVDPKCKPDYWECIGYDGTKKGFCQPNLDTEKCAKIEVTFDSTKTMNIEGEDEQSIPDGYGIPKSMIKYTDDDKKCYDQSTPGANDPKTNPACACGLQLFTKQMLVGSQSVTNKCGNVYVQVISENKGLDAYATSNDVVCLKLLTE